MSPAPRLSPIVVLLAGLVFQPGFQASAAGLADSPSALVRAQAGNPMVWETWCPAALERAGRQTKPVYVFVGSTFSGLTHATINQTFASVSTTEWINENFFCIFVDEDTQPVVAALAQHYINAVKQLRGSPVHLWLTPELQPYDGANYLPPSEEWGRPGFLKAARSALDIWTNDPARARALATEALSMMRLIPVGTGAKPDVAARLNRAAEAWIGAIDPVNGGFGEVPKNPEPEIIRFLLERGEDAQAAALNAARALVAGAVHDRADGGFYRRAIDEGWKEPYHQKTLADQARIAFALLAAADVSKDDALRDAAHGALDFSLKDLRNADGTFIAAIDGTLGETSDPAVRPKFVRVGQASTGTVGLLIAALQRTGVERFTLEARKLLARLRVDISAAGGGLVHIAGASDDGTATDYAAVALAFRVLGDDPRAEQLLARANGMFFDPSAGRYMATRAELPAGIAARVPTLGETPSAEVLALLAGADPETADLICRGLLSGIEYDELPPGDVLLGLSQSK